MKRTLIMIVADIVAKNKKKQYTAHELAELIVKTEREFVEKKIAKTRKTEKILVYQLMSEIGAQFPKMIGYNVAKSEDRPQRYFYKKNATGGSPEVMPAQSPVKKATKKAAAKPAKKATKKAPAKKAAKPAKKVAKKK